MNEIVSFSVALEKLKQGKKVHRKNWNGKNMFLFMVKGEAVSKVILTVT